MVSVIRCTSSITCDGSLTERHFKESSIVWLMLQGPLNLVKKIKTMSVGGNVISSSPETEAAIDDDLSDFSLNSSCNYWSSIYYFWWKQILITWKNRGGLFKWKIRVLYHRNKENHKFLVIIPALFMQTNCRNLKLDDRMPFLFGNRLKLDKSCHHHHTMNKKNE